MGSCLGLGVFHGALSTASRAQCPRAERQENNLERQADSALGAFHVLIHLSPLNNLMKLPLPYPVYRRGNRYRKLYFLLKSRIC